MSAIRDGYAPPSSTARSTPGWPRVACGAGDRSTSSPTAKAPKANISPATSVTAPTTAALAASTSGRRGTAAKVARIMPEENSVVIDEHAEDAEDELADREPGEASRSGRRTARSGADIVAQCSWLSTRTDRPIMPAAKTSRIHAVDRTLRSFSHSILVAERKP